MVDPLDDAIQRGMSIFPVGNDKRPLHGMRWKSYQHRVAESLEVARWRRMNPSAWAVVTGAISQIVILDFDGEAGSLLLRMNRLDPHVVTPSGGFHLWLVHPGWAVPTLNCKSDKAGLGRLFPGLDIRADGGYAVFTGRAGRGAYRWLRPMVPDPLERVPERMRATLHLLYPSQRAKPQHGIPMCPADPAQISEVLIRKALEVGKTEGRNIGAFWLALQARDNGFSVDDDHIIRRYRALTGDCNKKGAREPFTDSEALTCWRSAFERPAREAWQRRRTS